MAYPIGATAVVPNFKEAEQQQPPPGNDVKTKKNELSDVRTWGLTLTPQRRKAGEALDGSKAAAATPAAAAAPAAASARPNSQKRKENQNPLWSIVNKPLLPDQLAFKQIKSLANQRCDAHALSLGISTVEPYNTIRAMLRGELYKGERHGFVPVNVEPALHIPLLDATLMDGRSAQSLVFPCSAVVTGLSLDGIEAMQLRVAMTSHNTPVYNLLAPVIRDAKRWIEKALNESHAITRANVAAFQKSALASERHVKAGSAKGLVVFELSDTKERPAPQSFTAALDELLKQQSLDDGRAVLVLNTIDWQKPTAEHYPKAPNQSYVDILTSAEGLKFQAVLVRQRSYWLEEIGDAERKSLARHWQIHAQLRSDIPGAGAQQTAAFKSYALLQKANDDAIAAIAGGDENKIDTALRNMADVAFEQHVDNADAAAAAVGAGDDDNDADQDTESGGSGGSSSNNSSNGNMPRWKEAAKQASRAKAKKQIAAKFNVKSLNKTPDQRRLGIFSAGAAAIRPKGVHTFILIRRANNNNNAAAAAAAAAAK